MTITLITAIAAFSPLAVAQSLSPAIAPQTNIAAREDSAIAPGDYRIGAEDLLEITVFEAPEFNSTTRVSPSGEISIPMLGVIPAAGKTPAQLQVTVQDSLRRTHMKDPHVGVTVKEIQSHAVSVLGAVKKPGTLQIRNPKTLLEILSMAEGLADDAGDTVWVRHHGAGLAAGLTSAAALDSRSAPEEGPARAETDFGGAGAPEDRPQTCWNSVIPP
jgi:polysaccharide export outer membrane protein